MLSILQQSIVHYSLSPHCIKQTDIYTLPPIHDIPAGEAPAGSTCEANQFSCSLGGACIPLAYLCNGVGDCPNGDDESRCGRSSNLQFSS